MQTSLASPVSQWSWTMAISTNAALFWHLERRDHRTSHWLTDLSRCLVQYRPPPLQTQMAGRVAGNWRDLHRLSCSILRSGERRRGCSCTQTSGGMRSTKLSSLAIFLLLLHSAQASDGKATSHLTYTGVCFSRESLKFSSSLNELNNDFVEKSSLELAHLLTDGKCTKSLIMNYLHPKTHQIELLQH